MVETRIYGLVDPRNSNLVVYVGKTCQDLRSRLYGHVHLARRNERLNRLLTACQWWVLQLLREGTRPEIVLLSSDKSRGGWRAREKEFITSCRELNPSLLNVSPGGSGGEARGRRKICLKHRVRRDHKGCWVCRSSNSKQRYAQRSKVKERRTLSTNEVALVRLAWKSG